MESSATRRIAIIAAAHERGEPIEWSDLAWLLDLAAKAMKDEAPTVRLLDARDAAIRAARAEYFGHLSDNAAAGAIAMGLKRFAAGPWVRSRTELTCPLRYAGVVERHWWQALKMRDRVLTSRQVRRIIGQK